MALAPVATRILFDDIAFATSHRAVREHDARGAVVAAAEMEGWYERPRDATSTGGTPYGDGVVAGFHQLAARTISVSGFIRGTAIEVLEMLDRFAAGGRLFAVDERARLLQREADVRTIGFVPRRVTPEFHTFVLTLQADDPLRYLATAQALTNGPNTLINQGDREAWPVLDVPGPHGAITIAHAGNTWTLAANTGTGTRIVDLREGDVWQAGVRVFGLESGAAPSVPVGSVTWTVAGLGAGDVSVRRFGAWS